MKTSRCRGQMLLELMLVFCAFFVFIFLLLRAEGNSIMTFEEKMDTLQLRSEAEAKCFLFDSISVLGRNSFFDLAKTFEFEAEGKTLFVSMNSTKANATCFARLESGGVFKIEQEAFEKV
jgi:hypothetical protein